MRVFVLGTGRCGTTTFIRACEHLTNFTAAHESRAGYVGPDRFGYPDQHIEADNRLTWFLGELGRRFPDAFYVHLRRDPDEVVDSFLRRWYPASIIRAFADTIVIHPQEWPEAERRQVCRFYVDTVTSNVEAFLAGRNSMTMWLQDAPEAFPAFLDRIGAQGDLAAAAAEWTVQHNRSAVPHPTAPGDDRPADRRPAAPQRPTGGPAGAEPSGGGPLPPRSGHGGNAAPAAQADRWWRRHPLLNRRPPH